jgi:protein SCO1/2
MPRSFLIVFATTILLPIVLLACSQENSFNGTLLSNGLAPSFELHDQHSRPIALTDFTGKVVVLTFLYTHCADACPVITETLKRTYEGLGDSAEHVQIVAVSVDPERDTAEAALRYTKERGMLDKWVYLVGSKEELTPIWDSYYIAAQVAKVRFSNRSTNSTKNQQVLASGKDKNKTALQNESISYLVNHNSAIYLIDKEGQLAVLLTNLSLDPKPLLHDIRILL